MQVHNNAIVGSGDCCIHVNFTVILGSCLVTVRVTAINRAIKHRLTVDIVSIIIIVILMMMMMIDVINQTPEGVFHRISKH